MPVLVKQLRAHLSDTVRVQEIHSFYFEYQLWNTGPHGLVQDITSKAPDMYVIVGCVGKDEPRQHL